MAVIDNPLNATRKDLIDAAKAVRDHAQAATDAGLRRIEAGAATREDLIDAARAIRDQVQSNLEERCGSMEACITGRLGRMLTKELNGRAAQTQEPLAQIMLVLAELRSQMNRLEDRLAAFENVSETRVKSLESVTAVRLDDCRTQGQKALRSMELANVAAVEQMKALLASLPVPQIQFPENAIKVDVAVLEQQAPQVTANVPKQPPAEITVNVPKQQAPQVTVNVPEQKTPKVTVTVPQPRPVRKHIEYDQQGRPAIITESHPTTE